MTDVAVSPWGVLGVVAGLYVAQLIVYWLYRIFIYPFYVSPLRHLPGPKDSDFLVGHALKQFRSGNPSEPMRSWARQWPTTPLIRYLGLLNSETLLVTSLEAHKEMLQAKSYSFEKPAWFFKFVKAIAGVGVMLAAGEAHKKQRKFFNVMFSLANIRAFIPTFRAKAVDLSGLLERAIEADDGIIETVSTYHKIMLDVTAVFVLGLELNSLASTRGGKYSFSECYRELFEPDLVGQIVCLVTSHVPIRWLPIDANRRYFRASNGVRGPITKIVRQRIADIERKRAQSSVQDKGGEAGVEDLLTGMVEKKYFATDDRWTEEEIVEQAITFLTAGHDTTTTALVWATHVVSRRADVRNRLHAEIDALLARNPTPGYSEMEDLPYMKNFTREILRLYSPAINAPREAVEDVVIQGVRIPKGTHVIVYQAVLQQSPAIWGDDCLEFDPDRWDRLEGTPAADPHAFTAFISGPRMCIGKTLSIVQFKVTMIELLSKFDFESLTDSDDVEFTNPCLLLRPRGGLKVRVKRRV